ncbi:endonuclease/exonuclease/phosphatase family protein [Lunatibacter salilacus]|uniref:endonuclease/exonuclease/phosphatase family protein n=1 Tax=Lunatibacter salilacus TaxID=2483804 RepID=UPI00131B8BC0|nr:endonuclease/exonuclease/phosphatase family protein [Lunatibacter salilacus]
MQLNLFFTFLISGFTLIACQPKPSSEEAIAADAVFLKVAAYNVEYSKNASAEEIGEAFRPFDFDVVAFSEAPGGDWTKRVAAAMDMEHVLVGKHSTAGHDDKYKTIASKTPLYGYEEILMADTLHTVTKAKTKLGDMEVEVHSVHFPFGWRDQAHIDETTNKIQTYIDNVKSHSTSALAVLMGDFNFIPSNADSLNMYHEMFKELGYELHWQDLEIDSRYINTFNALVPNDEGNGDVIDHIMYSPEKAKAVDGGILELDRPLSDHKPVWALLEIKKMH